MSVLTITEEFTSPLPAKTLFTAFTLDADNLIPKVATQIVKSVEIIEGNGGPGTIKKITFTDGKYLKHRIDLEDKGGLQNNYTVIEGDVLLDGVEAVGHEVKFQDAPNGGGCKGTHISKFYLKAGVHLKEGEAKAANKKAQALCKAVEAYLIANPDAYA